MTEKLKTYYLGQHIQHFKGKEHTLMENWNAAFEFAQQVVLWAADNKIPLFSPAAYTIPVAKYWKKQCFYIHRDLYFFIDKSITERLRAAGELIWVMPHNWHTSSGCKKEVMEALENNEKVIKFHNFYYDREEIELDFDELHLWLELDKEQIE